MVEQLVGNMVATTEANPMAPLYYKTLENSKNEALKVHKGNYDRTMPLPAHLLSDIQWWVDNILNLI